MTHICLGLTILCDNPMAEAWTRQKLAKTSSQPSLSSKCLPNPLSLSSSLSLKHMHNHMPRTCTHPHTQPPTHREIHEHLAAECVIWPNLLIHDTGGCGQHAAQPLQQSGALLWLQVHQHALCQHKGGNIWLQPGLPQLLFYGISIPEVPR